MSTKVNCPHCHYSLDDDDMHYQMQELNRVLRDHRDMYSGQVTAVVYLGDQTAFEFGMPKKITLVLRHDGTFQVERHNNVDLTKGERPWT